MVSIGQNSGRAAHGEDSGLQCLLRLQSDIARPSPGARDFFMVRQETEGLQVRHLQLASCLHFTGHDEVGFRLDT